ncbi:MAG: 16S rRNA (guanine(966)-N(2))-methyltransferase RsmD [Verrucomicrobiota bacterium]|nr:16S rRNA (guanine(966)-N(2))-methyltransferase RsmD [Verrucomicrobiota bacterium]
MRVIAGSAGGLRLNVPESDVRPTMDRVKAAIFSSLGDRVLNARILDLFAGTGALGIEALSRGAASALFVENKREAVFTIEQNFIRTKLRGRVRRQDVFAFLETSSPNECFDIIFADPPYEKTKGGEEFTRLLLANEKLPKVLARSGVFVLEKRPAEELPAHPQWEILRSRKYGATEVLVLQHADPDE